MRIRLATVDDAVAISALIQPLAAKYIAHEFSLEGVQNLLSSMEPAAIARYFESGYRFHLATQDGTFAGVVGVRENRHLYHLFVAEAFQRRGLARRLWIVARDVCLAEGNPGEFTVNSSRNAVPVYRRFGFVESGPPDERNGVISIPMRLCVESHGH